MQKKIWVTILISGLFSIACGFFAFAAPNAQRLARLGSADTDGNNKVSVEEFVKAFPEQDKSSFDNYDKNGDGFLSREDFRRNRGEGAGPAKGARPRLLPLLKKADADGNGEVTFEEISAVVPKVTREQFTRFDRNGDGVISAADRRARPAAKPNLRAVLLKADRDNNKEITFEELQAVLPQLTKERFARFDHNDDGVLSQADRSSDTRNNAGKKRPARAAILRKALRADADGNKKVTYEEVIAVKPGFPRAAFDRFDVNSDGVLSRADIREGMPRKE